MKSAKTKVSLTPVGMDRVKCQICGRVYWQAHERTLRTTTCPACVKRQP